MYVHLFEAPIPLLSICNLVRSGINVRDDSFVLLHSSGLVPDCRDVHSLAQCGTCRRATFRFELAVSGATCLECPQSPSALRLRVVLRGHVAGTSRTHPYPFVQLSNSCVQWLFYHKHFEFELSAEFPVSFFRCQYTHSVCIPFCRVLPTRVVTLVR